jgi:hypothetical protein
VLTREVAVEAYRKWTNGKRLRHWFTQRDIDVETWTRKEICWPCDPEGKGHGIQHPSSKILKWRPQWTISTTRTSRQSERDSPYIPQVSILPQIPSPL